MRQSMHEMKKNKFFSGAKMLGKQVKIVS